MHTGRAELLDRLANAEDELLAAIEALEAIGPNKYSNAFDRQVALIAEAMGGVYRHIMHIDGDYLRP